MTAIGGPARAAHHGRTGKDRGSLAWRRLIPVALVGLVVAVAAAGAVLVLASEDRPRDLSEALRSGDFVGERVTADVGLAERLPSGALRVRVEGMAEPLLVIPAPRVMVPDVVPGGLLRIEGTLDRFDQGTTAPDPPSETVSDNEPLLRAQRIDRVRTG